MPETNPPAGDNAELRKLIRELEGQIETIASSLDRVRATVDRLSAAAGAPSAAGQVSTYAPQPSVAGEFSFGGLAPREFAAAPLIEEPSSDRGYGGSIAEGASWPSLVPGAAAALAASDGGAEAGASEHTYVPAASTQSEAVVPDEASPLLNDATVLDAAAGDHVEVAAEELPAEDRWATFFRHHDGRSDSQPAVAENADGAAQHGAAEAAARAEAEAGPQPPLSSGWPDESIWSQSFVWPAMKGDREVGSSEPLVDAAPDEQDDIRAIVAQVRADLEGSLLTAESEVPAPEPEAFESAGDDDDAARRAEVERTVEALKAELSGRAEQPRTDWSAWNAEPFAPGARELSTDAVRSWRFEPASAREPSPTPSASPEEPRVEHGDTASAEAVFEDEEAVREEVRRTVEAARAELTADDSEARPAFPMAAPRSTIMEWEERHVESVSPPIIVVNHKTGRVELSQVYETLNALECGDSAALLNYTPHSVTVGLPIWRAAPDRERMTEVAQRVFGTTCSVDSDGTRMTINVGEGGPWLREGVA